MKFGMNVNAGVALAYHAGNCDHNSAINSRRYSVILQESGETVSSKGSRELRHAWAQLDRPDKHLPGGKTGPRHSIVLDSWMDGPPVRIKDSALALVMQDAEVNETFGRASGLRSLQAMHHARDAAGLGGPLHEMTQSALQRNTNDPPEFAPFTEHSIIDDRFAAATTAALAGRPALLQELLTVATARTAYNLNVHEATRPTMSGAILDEATDFIYLTARQSLSPPIKILEEVAVVALAMSRSGPRRRNLGMEAPTTKGKRCYVGRLGITP